MSFHDGQTRAQIAWQFVHDLVAHPLMAFTLRSAWSVRFHAYTGMKAAGALDHGAGVSLLGLPADIDRLVVILAEHGVRECGAHGGDGGSLLEVALDVAALRAKDAGAR